MGRTKFRTYSSKLKSVQLPFIINNSIPFDFNLVNFCVKKSCDFILNINLIGIEVVPSYYKTHFTITIFCILCLLPNDYHILDNNNDLKQSKSCNLSVHLYLYIF